jgi:endonuclease YncB( thermonuclease family)
MRRWIFGIFILAVGSRGWGALSRVAVESILDNPDAFDGKAICVQGPAENVREKTSGRGNPYVVFQVRDGGAALKVFSFGRGMIPKQGPVLACGDFYKEKTVGEQTFRDELTAAYVGPPPPGMSRVGAVVRLSFSGKVTSVADGDTLDVMLNDWPSPIRFEGIDCPEKAQPSGPEAGGFTRGRALGRRVTVIMTDIDKYGRIVGWVILPDGTILNRELVREGWAWWYRYYAPDNKDLKDLEASARRNKKGLWRNEPQMSPWDFRHRTKK